MKLRMTSSSVLM
jgi:hypothetical protein